MSRRSVTNERYKGESKGTTRKSAASAKPKRDAGVSTAASTSAAKKPAGKTAKPGLFGSRGARKPIQAAPSSPEMKRLRRWWWVFMGTAVIIALAMVPTSSLKIKALDSGLFAFYAFALAGALYLEFGPLRRARREAVASAKKGIKNGSGKGSGKSSVSGGKPTAKGVTAEAVPTQAGSSASKAVRSIKDALGFGSRSSSAEKDDTEA